MRTVLTVAGVLLSTYIISGCGQIKRPRESVAGWQQQIGADAYH